MTKKIQYFLMLSICILIFTGCTQEGKKGLSIILQNNSERASMDIGRNIENSFALLEKKMEKNFVILENNNKDTSRFQQVEEVAVPNEEQVKTYLNMTISEIERITGNTFNEEVSITVFSFEDSYKGLYLDNSSFYFFCRKDMMEKPIGLTFYGKYHNRYLNMIDLSKDMNFQDIMDLWGETEIEASKNGNASRYRIKYERNGLIYNFVSENREGNMFNTYIELP